MLGLETKVSLGIQASATNPTTQARTLVNVYKIEGGLTEGLVADPIFKGGQNNFSDPSIPGRGLDDHKLTVDVPVCEKQFPLWLAAFLGTPVDSGTTNYLHTFSTGVSALPYAFVEEQLRGSSDFRRQFGIVGESMDIDWSSEKDGFAHATFGFVGLTEGIASSALPGTVTAAPALTRNPERTANITYNGVASVISGKLSVKRSLKRLRNADGTGVPYAVDYQGETQISGSFRVRYTDQTLTADQVARTARAAVFSIMSGTNNGLKFNLANMQLERVPVPFSGPDGIEYDITFKAWQTSSGPALPVVGLDQTATFVGP